MGFLEDLSTLTIEEKFHKFLPDSLYRSHYDLAQAYGHTPTEWRTFLRDNHLFIESELAAITEAEARSALSRLGNAGGQEVSALKALLDKSKLINDAQRQNTKVIMTFIPSEPSQLKKEEPHHDNLGQDHFSSPARQSSSDSRPAPPPIPVEPPQPERKSKYR